MAQVPEQIIDLIARGAMFVINHSGGKDSQAMYLLLRGLVPAVQRVIVHADLGEVEWPGAVDQIKATTAGEPLHVCRSRRGLLQMIAERGMFPSPSQRQCTSDLKRGPIERTVRAVTRERKAAGIEAWGLVVNCMGMRAEESPGRSKLTPFKRHEGNSKAGREWYDWLPIHDLTTVEVFARIAAAGQAPHWVYAAGMSRFSCCFCIMSNKADLTTAARLNPDLYRRYVELERLTGQVMMMPSKSKGRMTLEQITGISVAVAKCEIARTLCE
ncbi:phosphoadenosine phosphosulfate reductase family protein [Janthinobacterium sp. NKUCC06_STL]|nr:phosphoadenosine phosphosulfate reductase family protein [Janthinobacterium sp. NKUCC06_STL]